MFCISEPHTLWITKGSSNLTWANHLRSVSFPGKLFIILDGLLFRKIQEVERQGIQAANTMLNRSNNINKVEQVSSLRFSVYPKNE